MVQYMHVSKSSRQLAHARISSSSSLSSKREGPGRVESKDENSLHDVHVSGVGSYSGSFSSVVAVAYRRNSRIEGPKKLSN